MWAKAQSTWYLYKQWLCNANVIKFIKVTLNSTWPNAKRVEKEKTVFPKESVENSDLYEPVLNKILAAHE